MSNGSETCRSCVTADGCDPRLRPLTVGNGEANDPDLCRHYTCPIGMVHALRALKAQLRLEGSISEDIPFGSPHKPIGTRLIHPDGVIVSEQYGRYYPTGQTVKIPTTI